MFLILKIKLGRWQKQKQERGKMNKIIMNVRKFFPRCKSNDVEIKATAMIGMGASRSWMCNNCGYSNIVFPELKKLKTKKSR